MISGGDGERKRKKNVRVKEEASQWPLLLVISSIRAGEVNSRPSKLIIQDLMVCYVFLGINSVAQRHGI